MGNHLLVTDDIGRVICNNFENDNQGICGSGNQSNYHNSKLKKFRKDYLTINARNEDSELKLESQKVQMTFWFITALITIIILFLLLKRLKK
jgi:hypothetical protein